MQRTELIGREPGISFCLLTSRRPLVTRLEVRIESTQQCLEARLDVELLGIPKSYVDKFDDLVGRVTKQQADDATRARISTRDLTIVVVATASDVASAFERLPGVRSLEIVPFDRR